MKKQCNLCGLREDTQELIPMNKTWCTVYDKEVDNKFKDCEYWRPDTQTIRNQKITIAEQIKNKIKENNMEEKVDKYEYKENEYWKGIQKEYGISKKEFGRKIKYIKDKYKRRILFRDIEQAYVLADDGFNKPALILAGGVIEELLRLYIDSKNLKSADATFDSYIKTCNNNGLIKSAIHRLTDSVRQFRNLVHLKEEKSKNHAISKPIAKSAVSSIFAIIDDFQ